MTDGDGLPATVRNEFAMVELSLAPSPSGPVLKIVDAATGQEGTFDAVELEGLVWLSPAQRRRLLAPEYRLGNTPTDEASLQEG